MHWWTGASRVSEEDLARLTQEHDITWLRGKGFGTSIKENHLCNMWFLSTEVKKLKTLKSILSPIVPKAIRLQARFTSINGAPSYQLFSISFSTCLGFSAWKLPEVALVYFGLSSAFNLDWFWMAPHCSQKLSSMYEPIVRCSFQHFYELFAAISVIHGTGSRAKWFCMLLCSEYFRGHDGVASKRGNGTTMIFQ